MTLSVVLHKQSQNRLAVILRGLDGRGNFLYHIISLKRGVRIKIKENIQTSNIKLIEFNVDIMVNCVDH